MNKRIKELYKEAYGVRLSIDNFVLEDAEKKFAELIIRECAGIYDKLDNGNSHMGTTNYLDALYKHWS